MKYLLIPALFLLLTGSLNAAELSEPKRVSDILPLKDISQGATLYGTLENFPHTYAFLVSDDATPFSMQVSMHAKEDLRDVSLIVIREEKRGVSEIGRVTGKDSPWEDSYDVVRAVTFAEGEIAEYMLESGLYRMEVSSPSNNRGYRLIVNGGDPTVFKEIFIVREAFAMSVWSVIFSPYILAFIVLLAGILVYRKRNKHKQEHA